MDQTIGNRIAMKRRQRGMSQEILAEKLGVSSQAVSKWENDISCPDISLLPDLAKLLGISVDQLLTGKNDEVQMLQETQRKPLDQLTMRVYVESAEGDKVRVNLPMTLVKVCMEMGMDILPKYTNGMDALQALDLSKITELVENGLIGKIAQVQSAEGDMVEVVVE